jgi:hypothetical protein
MVIPFAWPPQVIYSLHIYMYMYETQTNKVALTGIRTTDLWIAGPMLYSYLFIVQQKL